jgi:hypothetical protein
LIIFHLASTHTLSFAFTHSLTHSRHIAFFLLLVPSNGEKNSFLENCGMVKRWKNWDKENYEAARSSSDYDGCSCAKMSERESEIL